MTRANLDQATVDGFGREWTAFDQSALTGREYEEAFQAYFGIFPFDRLPPGAEGFDLGCGSGRWAAGVAPRVGLLHCIDPSEEALAVARKRLGDHTNARFHLATADDMPLDDESQDFGYSLGVLHHIPDTAQALSASVRKLKPGAPFLLYVYYKMENRPRWYRALWQVSELARRSISRLPFPLRRSFAAAIAAGIYWPLARAAKVTGFQNMPLKIYEDSSFYTMRTDALDRFGTRLEQRFTRQEIQRMMERAGLENIRFSDRMPFWTACGTRRG